MPTRTTTTAAAATRYGAPPCNEPNMSKWDLARISIQALYLERINSQRRTPTHRNSSVFADVLGNRDLVKIILSSGINPHTFGCAAQVNNLFRDVCYTEDDILLKAALSRRSLITGVFAGLFWLPATLRNTMPKRQQRLPSGYTCNLFGEAAVRAAMAMGGTAGIRQRRLDYPHLYFSNYPKFRGVPAWFHDEVEGEGGRGKAVSPPASPYLLTQRS